MRKPQKKRRASAFMQSDGHYSWSRQKTQIRLHKDIWAELQKRAAEARVSTSRMTEIILDRAFGTKVHFTPDDDDHYYLRRRK